MLTDAGGAVVARHDYLPFGVEIPGGSAGRTTLWGTNDNVTQKFTGQERDQETGFDFFQARYFGSAQARFNSPDPFNAGADIVNPQSWNGYAYVLNNPMNATDPTGLCSTTDTPPCYSDEATAKGDPDFATGPFNSFDWISRLFYSWQLRNSIGGGGGSRTQPPAQQPSNPKSPPKNGNTVPQKLACAAKFGNDHSIGALFGGGKVAMFFGGNTVSSLTNLGLALTGNGPAPQYPGAIALSGPALGLPVNDALRLA